MSRPVAAKENRAVEVEENRYILLFIMQGSASKLLLPCFGDDAHSMPGTAVKGADAVHWLAVFLKPIFYKY